MESKNLLCLKRRNAIKDLLPLFSFMWNSMKVMWKWKQGAKMSILTKTSLLWYRKWTFRKKPGSVCKVKRDRGKQMLQRNREKVLATFPWSGKKSQRRQNTHTIPPGKEKTGGWRKKNKTQRVKTTRVRGDTIFYSQSESWIEILGREGGTKRFQGLWM